MDRMEAGDNTAKLLGRLSLNPLVHMDPIGTFLLPLMGVPLPSLMSALLDADQTASRASTCEAGPAKNDWDGIRRPS